MFVFSSRQIFRKPTLSIENNISSPCTTTPVLKVSSDYSVIAFNEAAQAFFKVHFKAEIRKEIRFDNIIKCHKDMICKKIDLAMAGIFQRHALPINEDVYDFQFVPLLKEHGSPEISITISPIENDSKSLSDFLSAENDFFQSLEYDRQIYRNLFVYNPDAVYSFDLEGKFIDVNASSEALVGTTKEELLQMNFLPLIPQEDQAKVLSNFERAKRGEFVKYRTGFVNLKNEYRTLSVVNFPIIYQDKIVGIYGIAKDITNSVKAQEQLRISEEKYRSLFDYSPLPMWVLDREKLRFLSVNKAAIELYGYTEKEFLGMTVKDLWAPNQENQINSVVEENYNSFFRVEVKHLTKNGSLIHVSVKSNPVILNGIEARVSLVHNITAKVQAEEKLIQSERRFKALIQEGSDITCILDRNLNYTYNSPVCSAIFGFTPEKMKGTNFRQYVLEEDLCKLEEFLNKISSKKRIQLPSYRIKDRNGKFRWIETIITNLNDDPAIQGIVMNSRDITEFVEQEQKLIESLERYNVVAKATSDLITDYDIHSGKMKFSEAVYSMFGYGKEEVEEEGTWWQEKIHPDDLIEIKPFIQEMRQNRKKKLTIEYRFRCADGNYKYILDRSYLLLDKEGSPSRIIASMQDITERKRHLLAVQKHNERLKEIAWTQSHVVRAPLAKLMGLIDLLKNYRNDLENIDEILENILTSAYELDKIIRKIAVKTDEEFRK